MYNLPCSGRVINGLTLAAVPTPQLLTARTDIPDTIVPEANGVIVYVVTEPPIVMVTGTFEFTW